MKTTRIDIRVQPELKDLWAALAADQDITLSEWIINQCTGTAKPVAPKIPKPIKEAKQAQVRAIKSMKVKLEAGLVRKHHPQCGCLMCKQK